MEALNKQLPIHDNDIRYWALHAREEVGMPPHKFTASEHWIESFKRKHGIVSRKVTKFITKKQILDQDVLH